MSMSVMYPIGGVLGWIVLGILALVVGFWLLFVVVLFIASRFEKIRFGHNSEKLLPEQMPSNRPKAVGEAMDAGLELVTTLRSNESNLITGYEWQLASPDRTIICTVGKSRFGSTFSFISRRLDGVWLVTKQGIGTPLREGSRAVLDDLQTGRLLDTLNLHRLRLRDANGQVQAFDANQLDEAGSACGAAIYQDLIEAGFAQWVDPGRSSAKMTWKGSFRLAVTGLTLFKGIGRSQARLAQVTRDAASLPPLGLESTSAPILSASLAESRPVPAIREQQPAPQPAPSPSQETPAPTPSSTTPTQYLVISRRLPNGTVDYLPYTVAGKSYLPVFIEESQLIAYNTTYRPAPGETRTPLQVPAEWLQQCLQMGYALTLNPHLPTRSSLTLAQLSTQTPAPNRA